MVLLKRWQSVPLDLNCTGLNYEVAFVGKGDDERSLAAKEFCSKYSSNILCVQFDVDKMSFEINNKNVQFQDFFELIECKKSLVIDATTLEIPEIAYSMLLAKKNQIDFDVIYVEPESYVKHKDTGEFELSQDGVTTTLLPLFNYPTKKAQVLIALGFEGHRFGALLESEEFATATFTAFLGVPGFKPGMEQDCLKANALYLKESSAEVKIAGASDPLYNYEVIKNIFDANQIRKKSLICAPFGTKPVAIAMIAFAINNQNVSILYDFVKKNQSRSKGVNKIHLWSYKNN